jgi:hypothetical protein
MSSPLLATTDRNGSRYYNWRQERYWSVTTICKGGLPTSWGLQKWMTRQIAEAACDFADELAGIVAKDRDAAVQMLLARPDTKRDKAANLGTSIHNAVEAYVLGKPFPTWPEDIRPRMLAFEDYLSTFEPAYEMAESSVFNRTHRYAGTLDSHITIGRGPHQGRRLLLDVKTGKGVYAEVGLQLAAYRFAEFVGAPDGSEQPLPEVDGAAVLHLPAAGGWDLLDIRTDDEVFRSFLYVREVFRWTQLVSKSVLLGPLKQEEVAA